MILSETRSEQSDTLPLLTRNPKNRAQPLITETLNFIYCSLGICLDYIANISRTGVAFFQGILLC